MFVDNIDTIRELMKFDEKPCFYKFMLIVRNKDGNSLLTTSDKYSEEALIKEWYVDSFAYFDKILPQMKELTRLTGGRLYMCLDRKNVHKVLFNLLHYVTDTVERLLNSDSSAPRRLNKTIRSITSSVESSEKTYRTWMYDLDARDEEVKEAIRYYFEYSEIPYWILNTPNGYHFVTRRRYKQPDRPLWNANIHLKAMQLKHDNGIELTKELSDDILKIVEDMQIHDNNCGLVYFNKE